MEFNTKKILQRLLHNENALCTALGATLIYFEPGSSTFSDLVIDCPSQSLFLFVSANKEKLDKAFEAAIPMKIVLKREGKLPEHSIKSIHPLIFERKKMIAQLVETENTTGIKTVSLQALPATIKEQIVAEVAELHLPVFLRQDGGFDLPETSFDEAWKNIGTRVKLGIIEPASEETTKSSKAPATPRLMNKTFTSEDIFRGKNGINRTLQAFLAKVNAKGRTEAEILEAIVAQSEYGSQLLQKMNEAYSKKMGNLSETQWADISAKIRAEAQKILDGDKSESTDD